MTHHTLTQALEHPDASLRLTTALGAGMAPHPGQIAPMVQHCRIEPDFFVRDLLTWALTRHAQHLTVPLLLDELRSPLAQARSQALHTLSKIGDPATWPAITGGHLHDPDPEVARTAWRTAAGLAPTEQRAALAHELIHELGRGDKHLQRSLSRALLMLGDDAVAPLEAAAAHHADPAVRERAVLGLAKLGGADAVEALRIALLGPVEHVRYRAARMLGEWGVREAIPLPIEQVVVGAHDVEAADALADLAEDPAIAKHVVERFEAAISDGSADVQARVRICQALAEIDGTASALLALLAADPDPAVVRTAAYVIGMRSGALA
ncbi:HEAT repeat domain-containing protein [Ralstonia insidiosa]|uniref:HEAT repeat domain-containing protein n=1 Tax=Ralstonia insidiosa TaxID=190721 RepID=A0A848P8E7_9RALS|nr:HEAT repeat domain-containing protein [Ralstonia insidiosa]NMV41453.1 HEAT repeat domain-containing protein [Ralstonia insidiosa]